MTDGFSVVRSPPSSSGFQLMPGSAAAPNRVRHQLLSRSLLWGRLKVRVSQIIAVTLLVLIGAVASSLAEKRAWLLLRFTKRPA
jgi:hypothetical protein